MIVTDSFVLLNHPKTGSTFARTVLKEIHKRRLKRRPLRRKLLDKLGITAKPFLQELMLPNIKVPGSTQPPNQHGCYCQIPESHQDRPVVTVVRNPYDRFLSIYRFRWWRKHPLFSREILDEHLPSFPDLSLDEFVHYSELAMRYGRMGGRPVNANVGNQTVQFIQMFFRNPQRVLDGLTDAYLDSEQVFEDLAPITFLKQEDLNRQLADFLLQKGYSQEEADYVIAREPVNVTPEKVSDAGSLWTPQALDYVEHHERMIFRILAARGIVYKAPSTNQIAFTP